MNSAPPNTESHRNTKGVYDVLKVPEHLPAGEYVLGWRYDCEATAQVWSNCMVHVCGDWFCTCRRVEERLW
jgi:hypothetical protein